MEGMEGKEGWRDRGEEIGRGRAGCVGVKGEHGNAAGKEKVKFPKHQRGFYADLGKHTRDGEGV